MTYKHTKYTCYYTYLAVSSVFSLPPLLFMPFREIYGISYTLLGTLVLVNFCVQLSVDLLFSFFGKHFDPHKTLRLMPFLTSAGLGLYALLPTLFPQYAFWGLLAGTVLFSMAAGLNEVLMSPIVAALPSENPEKDMSMLHSLYAWGVLTVVLISTVFLQLFGQKNWMFLTLFWAALPLISGVLYQMCPLPPLELGHKSAPKGGGRRRGMLLCVLCIFLGSAAENGMTNWISAFTESALGIPKALGDVLGLALFAILLGTARTLYAKFGKNILRTLILSMVGAIVCYLVAGLSPLPIVSMIACVLTGFCTSMLWPGTLILMEEKYPAAGVAAYALMAAGGDFGGSVAPQMLGALADTIGMKEGMLVAALFPTLGLFVLLIMKKYFKKER
ncbi:MAG: MFS transporter [Clostridia bacterium]|nr:MFS transporter [Clostridia bacterium]